MSKPGRREFLGLCAKAAGLAAVPGLAYPGGVVTQHEYARVRLLDGSGQPLRSSALEVGETYLFHYPMAATQCFLLRLGQPADPAVLQTAAGEAYQWRGGVGPGRDLVAYSAICAHKMAHPSKFISYIGYRPDLHGGGARAGLIACCAEGSAYDPQHGGRVLTGPADQPLASVLLDYDPEDDGLYAVGTLGGTMFERFFTEFGHRLMLEYPQSAPEQWVETATEVQTLEDFTRSVVRCGVTFS